MHTTTAFVEPNLDFMGKYEIFVAMEFVDPLQGYLPIRFMNESDSTEAYSCRIKEKYYVVITTYMSL